MGETVFDNDFINDFMHAFVLPKNQTSYMHDDSHYPPFKFLPNMHVTCLPMNISGT